MAKTTVQLCKLTEENNVAFSFFLYHIGKTLERVKGRIITLLGKVTWTDITQVRPRSCVTQVLFPTGFPDSGG